MWVLSLPLVLSIHNKQIFRNRCGNRGGSFVTLREKFTVYYSNTTRTARDTTRAVVSWIYGTDGTCRGNFFSNFFSPVFPLSVTPTGSKFILRNKRKTKKQIIKSWSEVSATDTVLPSGEGHQTGADLSKGLWYSSCRNETVYFYLCIFIFLVQTCAT